MDTMPPQEASSDRRRLCDSAAALLPSMEARAGTLDDSGTFPHADIAALTEAGCLLAPFPTALGGLGMGTEPAGGPALATLLRLLGRGNMAVGRLFEAHVNAIRLLVRLGDAALVRRAMADAAGGCLFGLWVTDPAGGGVRLGDDRVLHGSKAFCSGAGAVRRAVVGVVDGSGPARLAYLALDGTTVTPLAGRLQGLRAAVTGGVGFDGVRLQPGDWVGQPGVYETEPDFSGGAWRTSAVTCGGLEALVHHAMQALTARGRHTDPHQQARMGRAWIAQETALMWLDRAAAAAEGAEQHNVADIVATVGFARIAIEQASLDAMVLVERSIGLPAFLHPSPIERIRRDLATYLRQPAPDEVLTEAAAHAMQRAGAPR